MANQMLSGKIIEVRGSPNPNCYVIENDAGKTYLVHVGDLEDNEKLLYKLYEEGKIATLQKGDLVRFQSTSDHAIHVKKIN